MRRLATGKVWVDHAMDLCGRRKREPWLCLTPGDRFLDPEIFCRVSALHGVDSFRDMEILEEFDDDVARRSRCAIYSKSESSTGSGNSMRAGFRPPDRIRGYQAMQFSFGTKSKCSLSRLSTWAFRVDGQGNGRGVCSHSHRTPSR